MGVQSNIMKHAICAGLVLLCPLLYLSLYAQPPVHQTLPDKPMLFGQLPSKITISSAQLEQLFSTDVLQHINIPLGTGNHLAGIVKEKSVRNKYVVTVTIECTNYNGALLTVSRIAGAGPVTYRGRVVNIRYGDVLVLTEQAGQYYLVKEKGSLVVVE